MKLNRQEGIEFKAAQTECIWCKRIHIYEGYFCSDRCEELWGIYSNQSFKRNNRCHHHKLETRAFRGICWSCYKREVELKPLPMISMKFLLNFLHGFEVIPTFRTHQDGWKGDKIAFEVYLKDRNIRYFVYIKYYMDRFRTIRPIVVGKSGSLLVNGSGSDLSFSTSTSDGDARKFLRRNGLRWHYSHIAIKGFKTEEEAYAYENYIQKKFNLYGS